MMTATAPDLLTVRETADKLGVHPDTVRRMIDRGVFSAVRVGRLVKVRRSQVEQFIEGSTDAPPQA